jgi:hypothetical protein
MNTLANVGGLLPLWILVAPLVWAVFQLSTTPRPRRTDAALHRTDRP